MAVSRRVFVATAAVLAATGVSRPALAAPPARRRTLTILLRAAPARARRWRVRVTGARASARLVEFGLYRSRV